MADERDWGRIWLDVAIACRRYLAAIEMDPKDASDTVLGSALADIIRALPRRTEYGDG